MTMLNEIDLDDLAALYKITPDQARALVRSAVARTLARAQERAEQEDGGRSRRGKIFGVIPYSYKPSRLRKALEVAPLLGELFGVGL